jgi:diguanylate cyclase (GGDEF)-like protein/PAS domain S-box-containing protein
MAIFKQDSSRPARQRKPCKRALALLSHPAFGATLFVAMLCLLLIVGGAWVSLQSRDRQLHESGIAASNLAGAVEQQVNEAVTSADMILVGIAHRVRHDAGRPDALEDLNSMLATQAAALPQLAGLFVYDERGRWVANSLRILPDEANNADREYFRYHASHPEAGPHIGPPVRSRVSGEWILTISRRIEHPDGSFAGVALATIPLSYFQKFYARFDLGEHGLIALFRDDGTLLTSVPFIEAGVGANFSSSPIYQDYLKNPARGLTHGKSALDGMERLYAYRHSERYPLLVAAALARDDVLQNWKRDTASHAIWLLLLTLGLALTGSRFIRQLHLRLRTERRLAQSEQRIRAITDNLPALIAYVDAGECFRFSNRYYRELRSMPAQELDGMRVADVFGAETYAALAPYVKAALAGERVSFEHVIGEGDDRRVQQVEYVPDHDSRGRVLGFYSLATDISAQKRVEQELQRLARSDALTGLPNRSQLQERLIDAIRRSKRSESWLAVLFLDIDHFKQINDSLGHQGGDLVLKQFAARLLSCVRASDMAARLAGDEFIIVLEGLHRPDEAALVADKIVAAIRQPFAIGDGWCAVSTSIGIALLAPGDPGDSAAPDALLKAADEALYAAKRAGRNTWEMQAA